MTEQEQELTQDHLRAAMRQHAITSYPSEACGLIVRTHNLTSYVPCRNVSDEPGDYFAISGEDYSRAEDLGELIGVFHSHPDATHKPSDQDLASCQRSGLPWVILSWPADRWSYTHNDLALLPLYGREFHHGSLDCFGFIQAYYRQERGIELATPVREDDWWKKGDDLYMENYKEWGFKRVSEDEMQVGDVLLMQVHSNVPNHAAVLVEDGVIGHHLHGRLSTKDVYGGYWRRHTTHVMRYVGDKQ